jgi:hypothetical protein
MIQFRRGTTKSWRDAKTKLASGQPGYDKDKHKIKIGDGETLWKDLPYASGISVKEVLDSEASAKARSKQDGEDKTIITYGTDAPNKDTIGQIYLQHYDAEAEADYIVKSGIYGIWTYQQWKSGIAKCFGTFSIYTSVQTAIEGTSLFQDNNKVKNIEYPISFKDVPTETATLHSPGGVAWLASKGKNTKKTSGIYTILSPDEQVTNANYSISLHVEGFWK